MYKIIGADGKEYGPMNLEVLQGWMAEGRINAQSRVQVTGATEWKTVSEIPELNLALSALATPVARATPPPLPAGQPAAQERGLAVTSLVLGLLSLFCFGLLSGIPAVICGHIALNRSKRSPAKSGGSGLAIAGLVTGYVGIVLTFLVLPAMLLPALARAKARAQQINCVNNLKQVGLAFRVWALDHQDQFPFNVSTNAGGTRELCLPGPGGFDRNAAIHFQVISNELGNPKLLLCVADSTHQPAVAFQNLSSANISYQLRTGENVNGASPQMVLAVCPLHGSALLCDGSIQYKPSPRR